MAHRLAGALQKLGFVESTQSNNCHHWKLSSIGMLNVVSRRQASRMKHRLYPSSDNLGAPLAS